ncbi:DUF1697 domain-containing protein [Streptococcus pluranimalium]|uniref:DUF1697 domain-containing protein n=1 Tax=Streptococcus pluranimalium TaxID=82348 RepID=UPI0039FD575A
MKTYVCLLRGVNVGGKNRLSMTELKSVMENAGCCDVKTYINSGNIIFRSSEEKLQEFCQDLIRKRFDLEVAYQILSVRELLATADCMPTWLNQISDSKHNAIFSIAPWKVQDIIKRMPDIKSDIEQLAAVEHVLFWTCSKKDFSKTTYGKLAAKADVYVMTTVRNANTFLKLVDLVHDYVERFGT